MQNEPGVCATFPDPAVGNDVFVPVQARIALKLLELIVGLEGAIVIGCLAPRNIDCGGNVTATLRLLLGQVSWCK